MNGLFDLKDKVALVTGGTGVLGSAMASGLADAGAKVIVLGRKKSQVIRLLIRSERRGRMRSSYLRMYWTKPSWLKRRKRFCRSTAL